MIRSEYAGDPHFLARFRREATAARKVSGAFTASVVGADPDGDPPWSATQYVRGESLSARVRSGDPLPAADIARLAGRPAEALRDIHRQGIAHRDVASARPRWPRPCAPAGSTSSTPPWPTPEPSRSL
ncbi:hypothetical protein [Streptomyces plumbiresistens]|uniref:hypothetical protein n=1 Tax=Streptomyces plumbiresistens TaxID=511811 RepID=UPI0031E71500